MICEGEKFVNGLARQCGAPATVHLTHVARPEGRSPQMLQRHYCTDCGGAALERATLRREAHSPLEECSASFDPPAPTTPAAEPAGVRAAPFVWGGPPAPGAETLLSDAAARSQDDRHVPGPTVEDPRAAMRACDEARANAQAARNALGSSDATLARLAGLEEPPTASELGRRELELRRSTARAYHEALEALLRSIEGIPPALVLPVSVVTAYNAALSARDARDGALGGLRG